MKNLTRFKYILKNSKMLIGFCIVFLGFLFYFLATAPAGERLAYWGVIVFILLVISGTIWHYYRKYDKL